MVIKKIYISLIRGHIQQLIGATTSQRTDPVFSVYFQGLKSKGEIPDAVQCGDPWASSDVSSVKSCPQ